MGFECIVHSTLGPMHILLLGWRAAKTWAKGTQGGQSIMRRSSRRNTLQCCCYCYYQANINIEDRSGVAGQTGSTTTAGSDLFGARTYLVDTRQAERGCSGAQQAEL